MIICLMSLVGVPPFAGFIAKWWLLVASGKWAGALGWLLVIVAVINTLISLYYYMRVVVRMGLYDDQAGELRPSPTGMVLVNACAVMLLVLFVFAGPLKTVADRYSKNLFMPQPVAAQSLLASTCELSDS